MKSHILFMLLAAACPSAFAQAQADRDADRPSTSATEPDRSSVGATVDTTKTVTQGDFYRCLSLTGTEKEQCREEEIKKAQDNATEESARRDYSKDAR